MVVMRILGFAMIAMGILLSLTIIGAAIGIPMLLIGALFVMIGRKRAPIVIHLQNPPEPPQK